MQSEDEVRDKARKILGLYNNPVAFSGAGQITSFNQLGKFFKPNPWCGINDKPDGWYLPKLKECDAIILEAKSSDKDDLSKYTDEIEKNMKIAGKRYNSVIGILYNGKQAKTYQLEDGNINSVRRADKLQNKDYYIRLMEDKPIDVAEIYKLTARINNDLHFKFGIKSLYDRMIFTAGALVAVRYGAKLHADDTYQSLQDKVINILDKSFEKSKQQNSKLHYITDVYKNIRTNQDPGTDAIKIFVDNVNKISKSINSSQWNGEDVMAIFFNEFNRYKAKSENGQVFTPQHIASLMYRLINVGPDDSVLDSTCGSGTFLTVSMSNMIAQSGGPNTTEAKRIKQHQLYGIDFDKTIFALACANMMIHKDGKTNLTCLDTMSPEAQEWIREISWTNGDKEKGQLKKYHITKVLMNPPYERKYKPIDILNATLDNVPKGTDAAVLLPDFKLEKEGKRKVGRLLKHNKLLKIIKLPKDTFREGVTVSVFIFKTGEETTEKPGIFCCEIKDDGLETVKNQGRQDVKHRWPAIEDKWVNIIQRMDTEADKSCQWITPDVKNQEHLSFPIPQKPFEISDEDFEKTIMDYEMFKQNIDPKVLKQNIQEKVLYQSQIKDEGQDIDIKLKKANQNGKD